MNTVVRNLNTLNGGRVLPTPQNRPQTVKLSQSACKKQQDPIKAEEKNMTSFDCDINNQGGNLYIFGTSCLVHKSETAEEAECRRNQENGYGYVDDTEVYIEQTSACFAIYQDSDWGDYDWGDGFGGESYLYPNNRFSCVDPNAFDTGGSVDEDEINLPEIKSEQEPEVDPELLATNDPEPEEPPPVVDQQVAMAPPPYSPAPPRFG